MASESTKEEVLSHLNKLNIPYTSEDHPPAKCMDDLYNSLQDKESVPLKNLFIQDKKKRYYLICTGKDHSVNLKAIERSLNIAGCRFAPDDILYKRLKVMPGAATPLAAFKDTTSSVTFVFDIALKTMSQQSKKVYVHPMVNTASVCMDVNHLISFVEASGHQIQWVDFNEPTSKVEAQATESRKVAQVPGDQQGITAKKDKEFSEWYTQVIVRSDMVEYYDISGCYILRPWSYFMWEKVQEYMDALLKKMKVQNCYFPIFVTKARLETEKDHVEGFSPEVAWVTRYGKTELSEPIAIRPTSETIMYPAYARWIRSHRDLPLKLNQWCQVVRWEFKQPTPFLRTREFLWQEGHTAHASDEEALELMWSILGIYKKTYEEILAVPVIEGVKSAAERFAGGKITSTVETFISQSGRAIQAATSHHLGQNFSKMFRIEFEDRHRKKQFVHQTSWGYSTRSLGVAIMIHGDDKGMVLPPRAACVQVVCIPIIFKNTEDNRQDVNAKCAEFVHELSQAGIRATFDDRDNYTPGWKYNEWEMKGVPIRLELGPRDYEQKLCCLVSRYNSEKKEVSWEGLVPHVRQMLDSIHNSMLENARIKMQNSIVQITEWKDVLPTVNQGKLILVPWCEDPESEEKIKDATRGVEHSEDIHSLTGPIKSICCPKVQPDMPLGTECFFTHKPAKRWWLFGRSY